MERFFLRLRNKSLRKEATNHVGTKTCKTPQTTARPYERPSEGGTELNFGEFGLQATEPGWITNRQIEGARIAMTRYIRRGGKVWIKIFPDKPITQKPLEVRMGSGKGNVEKWVAVVKPGKIMFELGGVSEEIAREAMRLAAHKSPVKRSL